jgi:hypothetical protein
MTARLFLGLIASKVWSQKRTAAGLPPPRTHAAWKASAA